MRIETILELVRPQGRFRGWRVCSPKVRQNILTWPQSHFTERSVGYRIVGRPILVEDGELMARLSTVFSDFGYRGATLTLLAEASGLQKASLYHRFPGGKDQMAREVLATVHVWLDEQVLKPLREAGDPAVRIAEMIRKIDVFYAGGRQACLLNTMSSARMQEGPFTQQIKQIFAAWVEALSTVARDAGVAPDTSRQRAERVVMLLQGSLVFSRGIGTAKPFRDFLKSLPDELLGRANAGGPRALDAI
jgi:TetR/AcrR family transcriptional regulator, lmrAB and yxaGH operons repressor